MKKIFQRKVCLLLLCLGCFSMIFAQNRTISGTVTDELGEPFTGVSVVAQGTAIGVITDVDGKYSIQMPEASKSIVFTMIGYRRYEVNIEDKSVVNVRMQIVDKELEEVVVVGYGTMAKKDLTGAVGLVDVENMALAPVGSFTDALAGRVSGVQVSSNDGQPGTESNIVIRGANSITQSNSPLYIIDGIPVEDFNSYSISSNDIESMNVLKDASAIAIYGARAANGVIVITTKRGKEGSPLIVFDAKMGFPRITNQIDMMSTYEFVKYTYEFDASRANLYYLSGQGKTLEDYLNTPTINWQDEIKDKNPLTMIYDLSVRGGTKTTKYSISGSYYGQDGIIDNSGNSSFRGRINLDQDIFSKIKVGVSINASQTEDYGQEVSTTGVNTTVLTNLLYRVWSYRPYSPNDNLLDTAFDDDYMDSNDFRINPVLTNSNEHRKRVKNDSFYSLYFEYKPIDELKLRMTGAWNSRKENSENFNNSNTIAGSPYNVRNNRGQWGTTSIYNRDVYTNENTLTYEKKIKGQHVLNVVGGMSLEKLIIQSRSATSINVPYEELGVDGLPLGTPYAVSSSLREEGLVSYYGRINYTHDSRYLFTATLRADGSSKFSDENKWGYFPSVAAAWNVSEENFMRKQNYISSMKIRTSYGLTGNNRVGAYDYIPQLSSSINNYYPFNNQTPSLGVGLGTMGNPFLKWEETKQFDVGLDVGFLNNRYGLTIDYYNKKTDNLLLNAQVPYTTGYGSLMQNVGKVQNRGLEIALRSTNIRNKKFVWETDFNISFNRNKVLGLSNGQNQRTDAAGFQRAYDNTPLYITQVGKPVGMFYGFIFDGVYQYADFNQTSEGYYVLKPGFADNGSSVSPGDIKYRDINGDGTINDYDRVILGTPHPLHVGGLSNTFTYEVNKVGTFSLNFLLQWSYGNDVFNGNRLIFEGNSGANSGLNQYKTYENRWTPENPSNTLFRTKGAGPQGFLSDRTLEDGSYLRLKTVAFGYDLPTEWTRKLGVRTVALTVTAQNLFTWTDYSGYDPEVSVLRNPLTQGFDFCAYPRAKVITFGVRVRM